MTHEELGMFTHEELAHFTQDELAMAPANLMRRILDNDKPLPPSIVQKLNGMIEEANKQITDPSKKIKQKITKDTKAIALCELLIQIVANAPKIAEGFIYVLDNALKLLHG